MRFSWLGFEQILHPTSSVSQTFPQTVCINFPFYQLLPEHPLGYHPQPLLAHQLCSTQRPGVQEGEDVLCHMVQPLKRQQGENNEQV